MRAFLRKLRGVLKTGLTWAVGWSVLGTLLQAGLHLIGLALAPDLSVAPFMWGLMGFYGGSTFGVLLSLTEGRKTFENLRVGRVAVWGLVAGLAIPVIYNLLRGDLLALSPLMFGMEALIVAPMSAVSAGGMMALAQRDNSGQVGSGEEPALISGDGDAPKGHD